MENIEAKAKEIREKYHGYVNKNLKERVSHETKDTLKWINQRECRGYTTKESLREIEKSIKNKQKYED